MKLLTQIFLLLALVNTSLLFGQNVKKGGVRGSVYDKSTGEPIPFALIYLDGTKYNTTSNIDGDYTLTGIPTGAYTLKAQYLGYDSVVVNIEIKKGSIKNQNLYMEEAVTTTGEIVVTAEDESAKNDVKVSAIRITSKDITRIPAAGGEADFAQYLQVVPGVVFSGDQGGQFYIRGGAPIQNKLLLDGVPINSAFHSIGFFSVFETDIIRSADIFTGGFSSRYGGRASAVVDIRTREGNKTRFAGKVGANPFVTKAIFEGPLVKFNEETGTSLSFLMSLKHSYLNKTSPIFYEYATSSGVLPYSFTDGNFKLSFNTSNGSRINATLFSHNDQVDFQDIATYNWRTLGGGLGFRIVPGESQFVMNGNIAYSNYLSDFYEASTNKERGSIVNTFSADFNFTSFMPNNRELNYGAEVNSYKTDFSFENNGGIPIDQVQTNLEVAFYGRYKGKFGPVVLEPSVRGHYYASLGEFRLEPRMGLKWNITDFLRFKMAGGLYSQNMISSVDERDIVNLFVGYLGGPDEEVKVYDADTKTYQTAKSKLQLSIHAITGLEANVGKYLKLNVEPYIKWFPQIINLNRNRTSESDPTYIAEKGQAYGCDFSTTFEKDQLYIYLAYSLGYVTRDDGIQQYYSSFDRRHNLNLVTSYQMRFVKNTKERKQIKNRTKYPFEVSLRWNLGSGFPFTRTQGFFAEQTFFDGLSTNLLTDNAFPQTDLGILYENELNQGRLPYYHRLDLSMKYTLDLVKHMKLELTAGVTNTYNRENIFYFDRAKYTRVNQLPIMPAFNLSLSF